MELREVIGRRRSIRFLRPYMPVEPEKIQMMFEAARIATHWGNVQSLRAVAVHRHSAPQEVLDALKAVVVGWQLRIAPVVIVWYCDPEQVEEQGNRLRQLMDVGALGFGPEELKRSTLEEKFLPAFKDIKDFLKAPGLTRRGAAVQVMTIWKGAVVDAGVAIPDTARAHGRGRLVVFGTITAAIIGR